MPSPDATPIRNTRRRTRRAVDDDEIAEQERQRALPQKRPRRNLGGRPDVDDNYTADVLHDMVLPTLKYAASCLRDAAGLLFYFLKLPLTILLAIIMIRYMISSAIPNWMPFSFPTIPVLDSIVVSPCSIPIVSNFVPNCPSKADHESKPGAYEHMTSLQSSWDRMLDIVQQSAPIPMQMSASQAAIIDTRNMLKHQSQLPSKAQLLMEIQTYIDLSKQATYEFTDFASHVGRTVDKVISMNRLTLTSLDMFKNRIEGSGVIGRALDVIVPGGYLKIRESDVLDTYLRHASEIEYRTDALITEGEQVAMRFQEMENTLEEIQDTANRDLAGFVERKEELFGSIWTKLGGNAKDKKFVEKNIDIADRLSNKSQEAAVFVHQWLLELRTVKNDIIDLRARINEPRSRASMDILEIEEHIRYVEDGLNRLYEKRIEGRQKQQQGMQGIKEYVQGYWASKDDPGQIKQGRQREIGNS